MIIPSPRTIQKTFHVSDQIVHPGEKKNGRLTMSLLRVQRGSDCGTCEHEEGEREKQKGTISQLRTQ